MRTWGRRARSAGLEGGRTHRRRECRARASSSDEQVLGGGAALGGSVSAEGVGVVDRPDLDLALNGAQEALYRAGVWDGIGRVGQDDGGPLELFQSPPKRAGNGVLVGERRVPLG